jgi:hypothetical protein
MAYGSNGLTSRHDVFGNIWLLSTQSFDAAVPGLILFTSKLTDAVENSQSMRRSISTFTNENLCTYYQEILDKYDIAGMVHCRWGSTDKNSAFRKNLTS